MLTSGVRGKMWTFAPLRNKESEQTQTKVESTVPNQVDPNSKLFHYIHKDSHSISDYSHIIYDGLFFLAIVIFLSRDKTYFLVLFIHTKRWQVFSDRNLYTRIISLIKSKIKKLVYFITQPQAPIIIYSESKK